MDNDHFANNSACYTEKPDMGIFMDEWKALYDSKSGERGIFNRASAVNMLQRMVVEIQNMSSALTLFGDHITR